MGYSTAEVFIGDSVAPAAEIVPEPDVFPTPEEEVAAATAQLSPEEEYDQRYQEFQRIPTPPEGSGRYIVYDAGTRDIGDRWVARTLTLPQGEKPRTINQLRVVKSVTGFFERTIWRDSERHETRNFNDVVFDQVIVKFKQSESKADRKAARESGLLPESHVHPLTPNLSLVGRTSQLARQPR